jgi:hypothetical protein
LGIQGLLQSTTHLVYQNSIQKLNFWWAKLQNEVTEAMHMV